MPEQNDGATIYHNEIGHLPPLTGEEHLALVTGFAQVANGDDPTPAVAATCIRTLARLAGVELGREPGQQAASPGTLDLGYQPPTVVNLDGPPRVDGERELPLDTE